MRVSADHEARATGWEASLSLQLAPLGDRTRLVQRKHHGPLLVQRAFHPELPESGCCHLYLVHPPGGIVAGDSLVLHTQLQSRAEVLLTTPAATKFYRSDTEKEARQLQTLELQDASLEWLPQENIFFPGARARVATCVRMVPGARFIGWEMGCFGLPANERDLGTGRITQGLELWLGDRPLLIERLRVDGGEAGLRARWGLAGHAACGTLLAYPATAEDLQAARSGEDNAFAGDCALTLVDDVLVCRMLAARATQVRERFMRLWSVLRPRMLGRAAHPPRIWAT